MIINWGDAPFKAFLSVTYPRGTCTVSNGNKTYTHSGGGTHSFVVQQRGAWTVKATASNAEAITTVNIKKQNETQSITLKYTKTITVNLSASAYDDDGYQNTDLDVFATKQDLSAYKTIKFTVTSRTWTEGLGLTPYSWIRLGISSSASAAPSKYVTINGTGATTATLDISGISSGYISAYCSANASYTQTAKGTAAVKVSTVILSS